MMVLGLKLLNEGRGTHTMQCKHKQLCPSPHLWSNWSLPSFRTYCSPTPALDSLQHSNPQASLRFDNPRSHQPHAAQRPTSHSSPAECPKDVEHCPILLIRWCSHRWTWQKRCDWNALDYSTQHILSPLSHSLYLVIHTVTLVIDTDVAISACCCKMLASHWKIAAMQGVFLLFYWEEPFHWGDMQVLKDACSGSKKHLRVGNT